MNRRRFVNRLLGAAALGPALPCTALSSTPRGERTVNTVLGPLPASRLGQVLMHEHVLVDFVGADEQKAGRYDAEEAFRVILPHLRRLKELGGDTLVECTPRYLGRDVRLLQRLSRESGVHLITNTGVYGAGGLKYLPSRRRDGALPEEEWKREFLDECRGLDGTPVLPGAIKLGADDAPLPEVLRKVLRAAGAVAEEKNLPILHHSGNGRAALAAMEELKGRKARLVWVHAQSEPDRARHLQAARAGVWVEFDGIAPESVTRHVELVLAMREAGLLHRTLVSHDAGWYHVGQPGGGRFRGYETLFTQFLPALRQGGATAKDVEQLLVVNPRRVLTGEG